jgi:hypothetical protein
MNMKMKNIWPEFLMTILLSACCSEIYSGNQEVDVQPLLDAQVNLEGVDSISSLLDVKEFGKVEIQDDGYAWVTISGPSQQLPDINPASRIEVALKLADSNESAREDFQGECTNPFYGWTSSSIANGGEQDNQYCISYIRQLRESPEGLCLPTQQYNSSVVFQKDRLVITIDEYTYSESGKDLINSKDGIIRLLAQELTK